MFTTLFIRLPFSISWENVSIPYLQESTNFNSTWENLLDLYQIPQSSNPQSPFSSM